MDSGYIPTCFQSEVKTCLNAIILLKVYFAKSIEGHAISCLVLELRQIERMVEFKMVDQYAPQMHYDIYRVLRI